MSTVTNSDTQPVSPDSAWTSPIPYLPTSPQIATFSVPQWAFKGNSVPVSWRGTNEKVVQIAWKNRNTQEFHYLKHKKGENTFLPTQSGHYTFTIRSEKEDEISQTFHIWVINPLYLQLAACFFAAFILFYIFV